MLIPGVAVDSFTLRRQMWQLLGELSGEAERAGLPPFIPERLGRFDQQVSTKFHRDGGPEKSLLLLGYELSRVRSRFYVVDACRASVATGQGVNAFLTVNNPMFPDSEHALAGVVTEVIWPHDRGAIVVVNNSLLPDDRRNCLLGLLHKGWIEHPDPTATRVINSIGAMPANDDTGRLAVAAEQVERFLTRADLD